MSCHLLNVLNKIKKSECICCCMNHHLSHVNHYLTKCVLSLFKRDEISFITLLCMFTNTDLFELPTNTVQ